MVDSRRIVLLLSALLAPLLVITCASGVGSMTLADAGRLHKGMTPQESRAALPEPPRFEFFLGPISDVEDVLVDAYDVVSGDYSSQYLVAFTDGKLVYWGYPHEFARSRSSLINAIGEQAVARLNQLQEEEAAKAKLEAEKQKKTPAR